MAHKELTIKDRPDYKYWTTKWQDRKSLSADEYEAILQELEKYSCAKFKLNKRFKLVSAYNNIPLQTKCTVISVWPTTTVRWDKWSQSGQGSLRKVNNLLFNLDSCLEQV